MRDQTFNSSFYLFDGTPAGGLIGHRGDLWMSGVSNNLLCTYIVTAMADFTRELVYQRPPLMGPDVLAAQKRLAERGHDYVGLPTGLFGPETERAVVRFQLQSGLTATGVLDVATWKALFAPLPRHVVPERIASALPELREPHSFRDSISWQLTSAGVSVEGDPPEVTSGTPRSVERVWNDYGEDIRRWCEHYVVPVELIVATICTESGGRADAVREEPGYTSESETPHRVSIGLMQTLISTARAALDDPNIDGTWLLEPANSIQAGTAYISEQYNITHYDPPKVACAYNAGGIYHNRGADNRWKMRQYPIGKGHHADRYVKWFNDCFRFFAMKELVPEPGFYAALNPPV